MAYFFFSGQRNLATVNPALLSEGVRAPSNTLIADNISFSYGGLPILENLSFQIEQQERVSILGPSGSGKSTLLRLLAGVTQPTSGAVIHRNADGNTTSLRTILMFQDHLLLPWLSVGDNASLGVRLSGTAQQKAALNKNLHAVFAELGLLQLIDRKPAEISGGQRQRVALARTLLAQPDIILLDEPFSALDDTLRRQLQQLVIAQAEARNIGFIMVTHSHEEAATMTDRTIRLTTIH